MTTDLITDVIADTIVDATSCASRFNQNYTYVWHTVSATGTIITSFKMDSDKTIYGVASAANPAPDPVKSNLKTYIFDADYTEVTKSVISRMTNKATVLDENVQTVIIPGSKVKNITASEEQTIAKIFMNYGNIIIVEPTVNQWNDFLERLCDNHENIHNDANDYFIGLADNDLHLGMDYLKDAAAAEPTDALIIGNMGETHSEEHFCDMVVVCGKSFHILADLNDADSAEQNIQSEDVKSREDDNSKELEDQTEKGEKPVVSNEALYEKHADVIIEMLEEQKADQEALNARGAELAVQNNLVRGASTEYADIKNLMSAQSTTYQFNAKGVNNSYAPVVVRHDIWALCNIDDHKDYYIIRQYIKSSNNYLAASKIKKDDEWNGEITYQDMDWFAYGDYMREISSKISFSGANPTMYKYSPNTSSSSETHTSGFSFNLGGNFGFNSNGPLGGISGGVSFSDSKTVSIPDITTTVKSAGNQKDIEWIYTGKRPEGHYKYYFFYGKTIHDMLSKTQINDFVVENYVTWEQPSSTGIYELEVRISAVIETLGVKKARSDRYIYNDNLRNIEIKMTPPSRAKQVWRMSCDNTDGNLESFLERYYPDFWKPTFDIYTSTEDDRSVIDNYIEKFEKTLKNTKSNWIDHDYNKIYTFTFRTGETAETEYGKKIVFNPAE